MFIFDAGKIRKKVVAVRILPCPACKKSQPHQLLEVGEYITALANPLIPYKKKFVLLCQTCQHPREIEKQEFESMLRYNDDNPYDTWYNRDKEVKRGQPKPKPPAVHKAKRFCHQCGNKLRPDSRFCPHCGKAVL